MKKTSSFLIFVIFEISFANPIERNLIVENCKACHNLDITVTDKIPSLNELKKEEFIKLMNSYKNKKDNGVMNRISKVLTNEDIKVIADLIYDKK